MHASSPARGRTGSRLPIRRLRRLLTAGLLSTMAVGSAFAASPAAANQTDPISNYQYVGPFQGISASYFEYVTRVFVKNDGSPWGACENASNQYNHYYATTGCAPVGYMTWTDFNGTQLLRGWNWAGTNSGSEYMDGHQDYP